MCRIRAFELLGERVGVVHLREEDVRAYFRVVSLAAAERVDRAERNARAFEKFWNARVRRRYIGRKAVAFVEPVRLPVFADDIPALGQRFQADFAHVADVLCELLPRRPIFLNDSVDIDFEGICAHEFFEVEVRLRKHAVFDSVGVCPKFRVCELFEELRPLFGRHFADVFDCVAGAESFAESLRAKSSLCPRSSA